jgi:hypothetical protein
MHVHEFGSESPLLPPHGTAPARRRQSGAGNGAGFAAAPSRTTIGKAEEFFVMKTTTLATFRFPRRLTEAAKEDFAPQDLIDFLKIDPAYFHQSFRRKFKPKPAEADLGDIVNGEPSRARALDVVSTSRSEEELLEAMAALADFHKLIVREDVEGWQAIEPDFPRWREFPGAYVLWTARIVHGPADAVDGRPARLRVVRQPVSNAGAVAAVAAALSLSPQVESDGEDTIVSYVAARIRRPALAGGQ